jgi:transposase
MKLSDRVYICENEICTDYLKDKDRDLNAAINIHIWGLMATKIVLNTPGIGEIKACGDTSTDHCCADDQVSEKQEARGSLVHG